MSCSRNMSLISGTIIVRTLYIAQGKINSKIVESASRILLGFEIRIDTPVTGSRVFKEVKV